MKQFRKRMIATGLAVSVIVGSSVPTIKVFATNDVPENYFAKTQIEKFISEGIISGYPDGTFRPNNSITRAEFVKIVNKAFGFTEVGEETFKDVDDNAWYSQDIKIAVKKGYINGFGDDTFRPNEEITREQMAKILGTILNVSGDGQTKFIDDSKISSWARKYVDGLADAGFISGYSDGSFNPRGNATRGEGIAVISSTEEAYNQNIQNNNTSTENGSQSSSSGGSTSTGNGSSTSSGGGSTSTGNGNGNENSSSTPTPDRIVTNASEIQSELEKSNVTTVEFKGNQNIDSIDIPQGKTLIISGNATVYGNIDATKGQLIINGEVTLADGSVLTTTNKDTKMVSLARNNSETNKITGNGKIIVNESSIYITDLSELEVDFSVTSKSKLQINDAIWLDGKNNQSGNALITMHDDNTTLEFDFNSNSQDFVTVNGHISLTDTFRLFTLKSLNTNSKITLNDNVAVLLFGVGEVKGGTYVGSGSSSWSKLDKSVTINTNIETSTNDTIIAGVDSLKGGIGVSPDNNDISTETKITLLDKASNPMNTNKLDVDYVDEFRIKIDLGNNKKLVGVKLNGKSFNITGNAVSQTIKQGDLVTLNIRKEDYNKLGINKNGAQLNVTIIQYETDEQTNTVQITQQILDNIQTSQSTTLGTISTTRSNITSGSTTSGNTATSSGSTTSGDTTTSSGSTTSNSSTRIEVFVNDYLVQDNGHGNRVFDRSKANKVEIKITLANDKTLEKIVLNSRELSELSSAGVKAGDIVTVTLTKDELNQILGNESKLNIQIVEK